MEATTVSRRYRLERPLGEGGMAEVFLAQDLLLNRPVAIKKLHNRYAVDPGFCARFEREAERAGSLTHPHIVEIYDVGDDDGRPYIVMEYVEGATLGSIIRQEGPFDPDDVAALLEQVASALDYAHEQGIVHRDVKPQNILVDANGLAKVLDFGIAKGVSDVSLTDLGTALGTAHYVSPEQATGLMATPASDIYSLAVVAFEMLTRHVPFDGHSPVSIAVQHVEDPPPGPSSYQSYLAPSVDDIVQRGLAKNPTMRFRSAGTFALAMSNWRTYTTSPDHEARSGTDATAVLTAASGSNRPPLRSVPPSAVAEAPARDAIGRGTWFIGVSVLLALIGLVWFGASLSEGRIGIDGGPLPTTTTAVISTGNAGAALSAETATADVTATMMPELAVPSITGVDLAGARDILTELGILVQEGQPVYSRQIVAGDIAEQDPPAGAAIRPGQTVVVKRSLGSPDIDLSSLDLVGRPMDEARSLIEELGLNVATEQTTSTAVADGMVIRVEPVSTAMIGETVTLYVSSGP